MAKDSKKSIEAKKATKQVIEFPNAKKEMGAHVKRKKIVNGSNGSFTNEDYFNLSMDYSRLNMEVTQLRLELNRVQLKASRGLNHMRIFYLLLAGMAIVMGVVLYNFVSLEVLVMNLMFTLGN